MRPAVISLILPILIVLQALSDAGLVHHDAKPGNIVFFNGSPCLGDISLLDEDAATIHTLLTGSYPDKVGRAKFLWSP